MTIGQLGPGTVTCSHPQLIPDATAMFSLLLRMNVQGTITVASSASSTEADAVPADNAVNNTTTVIAGADFSVTLSAPSTLASGSTFGYALSVTNAGPDAATALRVQFPWKAASLRCRVTPPLPTARLHFSAVAPSSARGGVPGCAPTRA